MVAARLQEQHGMFRLFGCLVVQLFGCSAVQLLGRSAESVGRPRDGSTSPEMPVAFRRFCPESGSDSLSGPAFRTSFPEQLSGPVSGLASGPASRFAFRACFRICFAICFRTSFPGQLSGLASGSAFRMQVLFCLIVECEVWFRSGRRIRLRNFCRSSSRRRACNSSLPVFLDLCRVPMI